MAISREDMDRKIDEHFAFEARDDVVGWPGGPTHGRENVWVDMASIMRQLPQG